MGKRGAIEASSKYAVVMSIVPIVNAFCAHRGLIVLVRGGVLSSRHVLDSPVLNRDPAS